MIKAIVKNGLIVPRDPLPGDWAEGTEVEVEKPVKGDSSGHPSGTWIDAVEAVASQGDPEDDRRLDEAIQAIRRREKQPARTQLDLLP